MATVEDEVAYLRVTVKNDAGPDPVFGLHVRRLPQAAWDRNTSVVVERIGGRTRTWVADTRWMEALDALGIALERVLREAGTELGPA